MAFELAGERAVIVESAFDGDLRYTFVGRSKLVGGDEHTQSQDVFAGANAESLFEKALELPLRQPGFLREGGNIDNLVEVPFD